MAKRKFLIVIPVAWLALSLAFTVEAGEYHLIAQHSGKCLNVAGGYATNKSAVVQWDCGGGENDNFILKDLGNGWYGISPGHAPNMCLDIDWNRRNANGVQLEIYQCGGGDNQVFQLRPVSDGSFQIANKASGKCLDVRSSDYNAGAAIIQYDCKTNWWDPTKGNQIFQTVLVKGGPAKLPVPPPAPKSASPPPPRKAAPQPQPAATGPTQADLQKQPLNSLVMTKDMAILPADFLIGNTGAALIGNTAGGLIGDNGAAFATQSLAGIQTQNVGGPIDHVFRRALGRAPTREELAGWQKRGKVLSDEGFSQLIRNPKAGPLRERLVEAAFRSGRRRAPRPGEVAELARALQVSGRLYDQVVPALGVVEDSYRTAFNRIPEIGELSSWLSLAPSDSRLASRDALLASLRAFLRNPAPAAVEMRKALVSSAYKSVRPGASLAPQEMDWWVGAVGHYGWLYGEVASEMRKKFAPPPVQSPPKGRGGRRTNAVGG